MARWIMALRGRPLIPRWAAILVLIAVPWVGVNADIVSFPDPNLEAVIRDAIGKPTGDIEDTDLAGLTQLDARNEGITNLEGIGHCLDLSRLQLGLNQISDVNPLAGLTSLTSLWLDYNQISDISPLARLTSLTLLVLSENQISDIGPIARLAALEQLCLDRNQITDITPLAGLGGLASLSLSLNRISDIAPLTGLSGLTSLNLESNRISDVAPLGALPRILNLSLDGNQISDIGILAGMTCLQYLTLCDNRISNISPLAGLANLTTLVLDDNRIRDISSIAGLRDLISLHLRGNQISDITSLAGLTDLSNLALDGNQIIDISALAGLTGLSDLELDGNRIIDISALAELPWLHTLHLDRNQIRDVSPLAGLTRVHVLHINANEIRDIGPLVAISSSSLHVLDISWNYLSLDPASETMADLQTLLARGIDVCYEPQRDAPPSHTITTPSVVNGATSGETGELLLFEASGAECSLGHHVEYRFDWGDGSFSQWSSSGTAAHTYWSERVVKGYVVKAQARCADDPTIISDWSSGLNIQILRETGAPPEGGVVCVLRFWDGSGPVSRECISDFEQCQVYVGDSLGVIEKVRFLADVCPDGVPTGQWTGWIDWDNASYPPAASSGTWIPTGWAPTEKTMSWSFETPGERELWAEVKGHTGEMDRACLVLSVQVPEWRRDLTAGDMLYDPCGAFLGIGHIGIYLGNGFTADPGLGEIRHPVTSWDDRRWVLILRVACPGSAPDCGLRAAEWAREVSDRLSQPGRPYSYQWPLPLPRVQGHSESLTDYLGGPSGGTLGVLMEDLAWHKDGSEVQDEWYCSELVWAAYYNQQINIENDLDVDDPGFFADHFSESNVVRPHEICANNGEIRVVGGHGPSGSPIQLPWTGGCGCPDLRWP